MILANQPIDVGFILLRDRVIDAASVEKEKQRGSGQKAREGRDPYACLAYASELPIFRRELEDG
jgi:(p)ppGpp synthase/HD superfamily hydrolase